MADAKTNPQSHTPKILTVHDLPPLPGAEPAAVTSPDANTPLVIEQTNVTSSSSQAAKPVIPLAQSTSAAIIPPTPMPPTPLATPVVPKAPELPPLEERDEPRRERRRGPRIGCSCRMITCTGCLLLVGLVVLIGYVIINKPAAIWNPVKEWFNAGLTAQTYDGTSIASVTNEIAVQAENFTVGRNELVLTENQFYALVKNRLADTYLDMLNVDIEHNSLRFYWNLEPGATLPLWAIVEMNTDTSEQPQLVSVGTGRVPLPPVLNGLLQQLLVSVIKIGSSSTDTTLLNALVPGVNIEGVRFEKDTLVLFVRVSSGLESIFQLD